MNEYDSIKRMINCILLLIIFCFLCNIISIFIYFVKINFEITIRENLLHELLFQLFIVYFLADIGKDFNDERFMFIPEHYIINRYKVTKTIIFKY